MEGLDRFGQFVNRRELAALAGQLEEGERVLAAVEATHGKRGVLAATDRRLLFVRAGLLGTRRASWTYRQVLGVRRAAAVDDAVLHVRTAKQALAFAKVRKAEAQAFEDAVRARPRGPGELLDFAPAKADAERRERLERLDRMLARGSLTRAEYERAKAELAAAAHEP